MLIVVLDDDDELVIGKSNRNVSSPSVTQQQSRKGSTPQRHINNNNNQRNSPCRTPNKNSKHKQRSTQNNSRNEQKPHTPTNSTRTQRERPVINTQKLAQRLQNIKQDQDRRAKSPRKERTTPERSPCNSSYTMKLSHSEPQFPTPLERPHARIAKPVERKKKKKRARPDPEGAPLDPAEMDELDKILCSSEPLFSDYGTDEESNDKTDVATKRSNRSGFTIAAFAIGLGLNSNTMIKYAIISTELQNIIRVSLKMVCTDLYSHNICCWFVDIVIRVIQI